MYCLFYFSKYVYSINKILKPVLKNMDFKGIVFTKGNTLFIHKKKNTHEICKINLVIIKILPNLLMLLEPLFFYLIC